MLGSLWNRILKRETPDDGLEQLKGDLAQSRRRMMSASSRPERKTEARKAAAKSEADESQPSRTPTGKRPDFWSEALRSFPDRRRGDPRRR